ncbi:flavin reductase [Endozoicomonas ascidiicola]|uniref:flavin reductase n=1 Tax=Endozoicomonas ascidiicola TaxID=1698521 RepID=UPI000829EAC6|nr:flavin reductase [Endozoicomonas ascidiicola]
MKQTPFDTRTFRSALGTFTTGVTIITTVSEDGDLIGLTANSFNSVSLEPPLILWSLAKSSAAVPFFTESKNWNVHVLSVEQEALSTRFATKGEDKFAGLDYEEGINNVPLLNNCTARFQCRTAFTYDGGDHIILVGEVLNFDKSDLPPLVYQDGHYALTAKKPYEGVNLSSSSDAVKSGYTEDLLGYLLGRAHFQMIHSMRARLQEHELDELQFFILSVLCIQDKQSLEQLNSFIDYTGQSVTADEMETLIQKELVALDKQGEIYQLTGEGREVSVHNIAQARAIEESLGDQLGAGDIMALKLLLKRVISKTDPGLPDLWSNSNDNNNE